MEGQYGIEEFIGERPEPVQCLLKELYTDFIVQEVLQDKTVLRIGTAKEVYEEIKEEQAREPDASVPIPEKITPEVVALIDAIVEKKNYPLSCEGFTKQERTAVHEFIRNRYYGKLQTETKPDNIILISCHSPHSRKRKRWHQDVPNYTHFTMSKENKDTSYAIGVIARFLDVQTSGFKTHGIKDRRAVTSQRISVNRIEKERIMALNSRLRDIRVYDCEYKDQDIKTGGHWGNRFSIVLRNLEEKAETLLPKRLEDFAKLGFINYFGTQRFGSCGTDTASIGKLVLQRKWEDAVRMILGSANLPDYMGTVGDALRCWNKTGNASAALRCLKGSQSYASIEASILRALSNDVTYQNCITECLPVNIRSLYVHAYQSLLWNKAASRRIRENGLNVLPTDIGKDGQTLPEGSTIFDVYLPLCGHNPSFQQNYVSEWYVEMLKEDGLDFDAFKSLENRFSLGEANRVLMFLPDDVKWEFVRYSSPRSYIQDGISTEAETTNEGQYLALKVQFSLRQGMYATVALRQLTGVDMGKANMKNAAAANKDKEESEEALDAEDAPMCELEDSESGAEIPPVAVESTDEEVQENKVDA